MDWSSYYPNYIAKESEESADGKASSASLNVVQRLTKDVEVADIGCGFGGLLVALAPVMPDTLLLGIKAFSAKSCSITD
jgi:tRNA (guanine-N7-)-methyltransferase